jgi:hypothetical protein
LLARDTEYSLASDSTLRVIQENESWKIQTTIRVMAKNVIAPLFCIFSVIDSNPLYYKLNTKSLLVF